MRCLECQIRMYQKYARMLGYSGLGEPTEKTDRWVVCAPSMPYADAMLRQGVEFWPHAPGAEGATGPTRRQLVAHGRTTNRRRPMRTRHRRGTAPTLQCSPFST